MARWGNALWTGVRLREILDLAGVKNGSPQLQFQGLETGLGPAGTASNIFLKVAGPGESRAVGRMRRGLLDERRTSANAQWFSSAAGRPGVFCDVLDEMSDVDPLAGRAGRELLDEDGVPGAGYAVRGNTSPEAK